MPFEASPLTMEYRMIFHRERVIYARDLSSRREDDPEYISSGSRACFFQSADRFMKI
jgi:hypothetical protein